MAEPLFLIVDLTRTRVSESVVFWRASSHGYTVDFDDAGHYGEEEARLITGGPDSDNIAVPVDAIPESSVVRVFLKSQLIVTKALANGLTAAPEVPR